MIVFLQVSSEYYYLLRFCVKKNKATKAVTNLPKPGTVLLFSKKIAQHKLPFGGYYDFECYYNYSQGKDAVHTPVTVSYSMVSNNETKLNTIKAKSSDDNVSTRFV